MDIKIPYLEIDPPHKYCGVYAIYCLENHKFYIGSSHNVRKRLRRHKKQLQQNVHVNGHLQNAWNKIGEAKFIFMSVEKTSLEDQFTREQYYFDLYQCYKNDIGYNIVETADFVFIPEETRERISQRTSKPFKFIHIHNGSIMEGANLFKFCEENSLCYSNFAKLRVGKLLYVKNYINYCNLSKREDILKVMAQGDINREKASSKVFRLKIQSTGEIITITNIEKFCKQNNLPTSKMRSIAAGRRTEPYGGYCQVQFNFKDASPKKFKVVAPNGAIVEGENIRRFSELNDICALSLGLLVNGKKETVKGWKLYKEPIL